MKQIHSFICLFITLFHVISLSAQDDYRFFTIAFQEDGMCYGKCMIQTQYDTISESILVAPSYSRYTVIAPTFDEIEETIEIIPERIEYKIIPAVYESIEEVVVLEESYLWYKETSRSKKDQENCLVATSEKIEIAPPVRQWNQQERVDCKSKDWNDCVYFLLENMPTQYFNSDLRVDNCPPLAPEAITEEAKTITVTRKILVTPQRVEEIRIPAAFKTIIRKVIRSEASTTLEEVPTQYESVDKLILKKEGGEIIKMNVLCEDLVISKLPIMQKKLKEKGYLKGKIDKQVSDKLKAALTKYQIDYGLPIGQFDYLTMNHLGLSF